jgi:hypothetical protein
LLMCHCRNTRCAQDGRMGNASALQTHGSDRGEVRLHCPARGDVISARTGTAYAGIPTDLTQYAPGAKFLAEGLGVQATARILAVDQDTVNQWLKSLGTHGVEIMKHHFRHLHLTECQLDELWTFVKKKEGHLTPLEHMLGFCQVVETRRLNQASGATPRSSPPIRRPAPCLSLQPNSRIASAIYNSAFSLCGCLS